MVEEARVAEGMAWAAAVEVERAEENVPCFPAISDLTSSFSNVVWCSTVWNSSSDIFPSRTRKPSFDRPSARMFHDSTLSCESELSFQMFGWNRMRRFERFELRRLAYCGVRGRLGLSTPRLPTLAVICSDEGTTFLITILGQREY